jgi:hypothetical protein
MAIRDEKLLKKFFSIFAKKKTNKMGWGAVEDAQLFASDSFVLKKCYFLPESDAHSYS